MLDKNFKREVCFSFFESYLQQGKMVQQQMGDKACADYFVGLAEYALYQKSPSEPMTDLLITGLKNTIDACQEKRERAFNREDTELSERILNYIEANPQATEREVAKALGCSNGKVNKVKQKYLHSNDNTNSNNKSNPNLNNNTVSMSESKDAAACLQTKKLLEDLTEEELDLLLKKFKSRVQYKQLYAEFNLASGILDKDLETKIMQVKENKEKESRIAEIRKSFDNCSEDDLMYLSENLDCDISEVIDVAISLGEPMDVLIAFFRDSGEVFNKEYYLDEYAEEYATYLEFILMGIRANVHTPSLGYTACGF